jgi:hypothetical protein
MSVATEEGFFPLLLNCVVRLTENRYGCCDPGSMRFDFFGIVVFFFFFFRYAEDNYAYALFSKASLKGGEPMSVLKVDLNTGDKTGF